MSNDNGCQVMSIQTDSDLYLVNISNTIRYKIKMQSTQLYPMPSVYFNSCNKRTIEIIL